MNWLNLTLSLPAKAATVRMRIWRAVKTSGAAVLRDGVYLLPVGKEHHAAFTALADEVRKHNGMAYVLEVIERDGEGLQSLFDRSAMYAEFLATLKNCKQQLSKRDEKQCEQALRKQRKLLDQIIALDFFPGSAQTAAMAALEQVSAELARRFSPEEPHPQVQKKIVVRELAKYQRRTWATRQRPRIDRLASAWLIRRHIDPKARFVWLKHPKDCPAKALGFDFDGAEFTHVNELVTFENLLASFALHTPALHRLAAIVHALDVGGERPSEAEGLERILEGYRASLPGDDALLEAVLPVFDSLMAAFAAEATSEKINMKAATKIKNRNKP